jgi:hypothetical protein
VSLESPPLSREAIDVVAAKDGRADADRPAFWRTRAARGTLASPATRCVIGDESHDLARNIALGSGSSMASSGMSMIARESR